LFDVGVLVSVVMVLLLVLLLLLAPLGASVLEPHLHDKYS
jgi:hypothetical protein